MGTCAEMSRKFHMRALDSLGHTYQRVLVRSRDSLELFRGRIVSLTKRQVNIHRCSHHVRYRTHEPTPTATLDSSCRRIELCFELLRGSKVTLQSLLQRSIRELTPILARRGQVRPKQRMIDMS